MDPKFPRVKLLIDKTRNRVIFAESDSHFVDILFSFLTLPVGTAARLGSTQIGSINQIHRSVSTMDPNLFQTYGCKEMLLNPRNASETWNLKTEVNPMPMEDTIKFYICDVLGCRDRYQLSTSNSARCGNGHVCKRAWGKDLKLNRNVGYENNNKNVGYENNWNYRVFVKDDGARRFIITDDLRVMHGSSTTSCIFLLNKFGINDLNEVEERTVKITEKEVLNLLKFSLVSESPLTKAFLSNEDSITAEPGEFEQKKSAENKKTAEANSYCIKLKLLVSKTKKQVLYAEVGVNMVDFLFSFLTFPLGSIVKLLCRNSNLCCIDNLYKSVEYLSTASYIKSEECKKMLVCPKLAPVFTFTNQLLQIEEEDSYPILHCWQRILGLVTDEVQKDKLAVIMGPKTPTGETQKVNGFMKGPARFIVTNDLTVAPMSPISSINILNSLNVTVDDVIACTVTMGKDEALKLMKASLHSKTVLTDVFYPPKDVFLADDEGMDTAPFPPTIHSVFHWVLSKYCFDWVLDKHWRK